MRLLDQIRAAAAGRAWSSGVEMARAGRVLVRSSTDDEVELSVEVPGKVVPAQVHLWPEDGDWSCDCGSRLDVCAHICAGVIAWSKAERTGDSIDAARVPHIGYRFQREGDQLALNRVIVSGQAQDPLPNNNLIAAVKNQRIATTQADIDLDEALRTQSSKPPRRERMPRLLERLSECADVTLDGKAVTASADPVVPHGRVDDHEGGFRVRVVRDSTIEEVFSNGVVRCGNTLRSISNGGLNRDQRLVLQRGIEFSVDEVGKLVSEVLPELRKKVPVDVRTDRLPEAVESKPRIVFQTEAVGPRLKVLPQLVYGDPPAARIDRGQLHVLGGTVPIRSESRERRLVRQVADELGLAVGIPSEFVGEAAVRFVERASRVRGMRLEGPAASQFIRKQAIEPEVSLDGDRLDVDFGGADPDDVIEAWIAGERMVALGGGGWAPLPLDWLSAHGHLLADLLASRDAAGRVARHATFDLARLAEALNFPPPPSLDGLMQLAEDFSGLPDTPLPEGANVELRGYQQVGLNWLTFLKTAGLGGILADDMGLGKTIQALCAIEAPALVVAPTSVIHNWAAEAKRFRPNLSINVYHGSKRVLKKTDITLTSYALLRLDIERLSEESWQTVVLDEAQAIKNPTSQVARAAGRLGAQFKLAMTGTPVENRLDELWSQMHFVNPGLLGGRRDFNDRVALPISRGEGGAAKHLRHRIRPFVLRRTKDQVAKELPPRTEMVMHCILSEAEQAVYDTVRAAGEKRFVEAVSGGNVLGALEVLLRLRQAACHPGLVPGQIDPPISSKLELLREVLDEIASEGHKTLVFSQWTSLLDRVEPVLDKAGLGYMRLDGSTRDRAGVVNAFQADDGPPVFLLSLKAGGVGLNLTAADHVILLDPWWNPAVEDQAADRAHRIGQDKPVLVIRLVAENTVEERLLELQDKKRALAEAALGDAAQAAALTRDDLLALLG